jgi:hypothetical protein
VGRVLTHFLTPSLSFPSHPSHNPPATDINIPGRTQKDKEKYFQLVAGARSLQNRFVEETGIDIVARVAKLLAQTSGLPVRTAMEGEREYFAGLLRTVNSTALIHADFAPYVRSPNPPSLASETELGTHKGRPRLGDRSRDEPALVERPAEGRRRRRGDRLRQVLEGRLGQRF